MPKYSTHEPPTVPLLRPPAERRTQQLSEPTTESAAPAKGPDLTINKVIAGAGAAATSAILGSYFGAAGTVTGAAFGSVASTIATVVYQRSLDRTRDRIAARIKLMPGRRTDVAQDKVTEAQVNRARVNRAQMNRAQMNRAQVAVPAQRRPSEAKTVRMQVEPAIERRRPRPWVWIGATVLVFTIGLLAVTGLEWAKGSSLTTGERGTSVGRVLSGGGDSSDRTEAPSPAESTHSPTESTQSTEPSSPAEPSTAPSEAPPTPSQTPQRGETRTHEPSWQPGVGTDQPAPESNSNPGTESGSPRTPLAPVPGGGGAADSTGGGGSPDSTGGASGPGWGGPDSRGGGGGGSPGGW